MKTAQKLLVLFITGLILVSSLIACGGKDESDDSNKEQSKFDQYKKLSPEEIYEALLEANEYTVCTTVSMKKSGKLVQKIVYNLDKDHNKLKAKMANQSGENDPIERLSYCDLENNYVYVQSDDKWNVRSDVTDLDEVLEDIAPKDLLFKKENYGEYDSTNRNYPFLAEAIASEFGEEGLTCSGSMTRKGTTYTFVISANKDDAFQDVNIVIEFKNVSVKLPEADIPATQTNSVSADQNNKPSQDANTEKPAVQTTKAPETAKAPIATKAQETASVPETTGTTETEKPKPNFSMYSNLAPDSLYKAMLDSPELYLFIEINRDQVKLEKTGNIVKIDYYYASSQKAEMYYVDMSSKVRYQWKAGYPKENYPYTWEQILNSVGITPTTHYLLNKSYKSFDSSVKYLEIDPKAISHTIRSATLQRNDTYYHYEESISSSKYTKVTIHFKQTNTKLPAALS